MASVLQNEFDRWGGNGEGKSNILETPCMASVLQNEFDKWGGNGEGKSNILESHAWRLYYKMSLIDGVVTGKVKVC